MLQFKKIFKLIVVTVLCLMVLFSNLSVSAKEVYSSYTYGNEETAENAPEAVAFYKTIDSSSLGFPVGAVTDLYYHEESKILFAVDQTNNCILKLDFEGNLLGKIESFNNVGKEETFFEPTGVFVDEKQNIYICDTGNHRIVHLNNDLSLVRIIDAPESTILGKDFVFNPTHLVIDSIDRFYVISTGFNQGVLCLDEKGNFLNCLGTPAVTFNMVDYLWKMISTEKQKDRMEKYIPTEYNNISIDNEDFLYVTCSNYTIWNYISGEAATLKKLNAKGRDIIASDGAYKPYGDRTVTRKGNHSGGSVLVDVLSMDYGMFCSVDRNRGKVFVYNNNSQLLFEFGTIGDYNGSFSKPSSVEYTNRTFAISDSQKCNISLFKVNDYGNKLIETARLHQLGDYEAEEKLWSEIFTLNNNSTIALTGLANVEHRNGDYKSAMKNFKSADDTEGYAKAFKEYRKEMLNEYAIPIIVVLCVALTALIVISKLYKRRFASDNYNPGRLEASLEFGRRTPFRPLSRFWDLTWENKGTMSAAFVIFAVTEIVMILDAYCTGYIFAGKSLMFTNPFTVIFKVPVLLLLYCVCNWCVTSLMDGKATFKQIWMANCYALVPLIFLLPPATLLSNFITADEGSFYGIVIGFAYIWMLLLIVCANKQIHDYEFGKSILVLIITVLVMVVAVFLFVLMLSLLQQMYDFVCAFIKDIINTI